MSCKICVIGNRAEIWVPHSASASEVDNCVRRCRVYGQRVVVYRSGRADLVDMTAALLQVNRNISANRE